jgi:hypothetical protein
MSSSSPLLHLLVTMPSLTYLVMAFNEFITDCVPGWFHRFLGMHISHVPHIVEEIDLLLIKIIVFRSLTPFPHLSPFTDGRQFPRLHSCPGESSTSLVAVIRTSNHTNTRTSLHRSTEMVYLSLLDRCSSNDFHTSTRRKIYDCFGLNGIYCASKTIQKRGSVWDGHAISKMAD